MGEDELVELGNDYDFVTDEGGGDDPILLNPDEGGGDTGTDTDTDTDTDVVDPTEDDVMPIGVRTSMGEGMGWATRNADGSVSYEDPDGSTYTKTASGQGSPVKHWVWRVQYPQTIPKAV